MIEDEFLPTHRLPELAYQSERYRHRMAATSETANIGL